MTDPVGAALARAQRELLDLSTRNRLLSLPTRSAGVLPIAGERSASVFARLVSESKAMGFAPMEAEAEGEAGPRRRRAAAAPGAASLPDPDDLILSAPLTATALARVLTRIERDARGFLQEQGLNILFLALGQLVWSDPRTPGTERRAPLLLVPCTLTRATARDAFRLRWDGGEIAGNLTLAAMLADQFRIRLPEPPELDERAADAWTTAAAWFGAVAEAVASAGFRVETDGIALGLFSFAKYLMYRDLERPEIASHKLVRALLGAEPPPRFDAFPDDADIDALIPVEKLDFALDSDGSQTLAAEAVRRGASVVIQGPPGTGKSQVITNLIVQAVLDGKTVLFVAEKLAALEVVQRRLAGVGLGAACLALHSDGANRRALLAELDATLKAPRPAPPDREAVIRPLGALRGRLNRHAAAMHAAIGATGWTAFRAIGEVARLKQAGVRPPELRLDAAGWTAAQIRDAQRLTRELAATVQRIGLPARHPWRGVRAITLLPTELDRLPARIPPALEAIAALRAAAGPEATLAAAERTLAALQAAAALAAIRARAPGLRDAAWTTPGIAEAREELAKGSGFLRSFSGAHRAARDLVAALFAAPPADPVAALDAVLEGQRLLRAAPDAATVVPDPTRTATLEAALARYRATAEPLFAGLALDRAAAFGTEDPPLAALAERLAQWAAAPAALADWLAWARLAAQAAEVGISTIADRLADGRIAPEDAAATFRFALAEALMAAAMRANPTLAAFDGPAFSRLVEEFRQADQARLALARAEAAAAHASRLRIAEGPDMLREMAVLRGEIAKRSRHLPIRTLLARAGPAVQAIKPVFMMSPLSVAAFLDPAAIGFDMLVIDEASQIEPVDALGAVARCRQIVVVGDDRQMPPTRFFARLTGGDEDEDAPDEETIAASDVESILSLCTARGFPNQMLRWHYRSRHESLIAVSNRAFYENRLLVIPSPRPRGAELGLSLVRVDGAFDTGGTGTNAVEAQAVAEAVLAHAREHPKDTLGVAAFSIRQRDAILDAIEALRRDNPDTEPFFAAHPHEPFFVKNLENVQGDERDVMFISVGYAKGPDGRLAMRFGPLSADGGERRLNVLITRAKKRCVVFSGLTAEDIDLARASGRGVAVLKDFLAFAAGGSVAAAQAGEDDAALSDAIATALEGAGVAVARRVGLAGLFVDVAVKDADGYRLGILTDGDFYASARSARDRDRLQEGALAMMGWRLTRSWAADWLVRPEAEARRLAALAGVAVEEPPGAAAAPAAHGLSTPYTPAAVAVPTDTPPDAMPFARLGGIVAAIVRAEGPIHGDAVIARAAALWGIETPTAKQRAALAQALRLAKELEGLIAEGEFWRGEDSAVVPRDRSALPAAWRRPDWLPPAEIRAALLAALEAAAGGVDPQSLDTAALRLLGMGEDARPAIAAQRALLTGEGRIALSAGLAVPGSAVRR